MSSQQTTIHFKPGFQNSPFLEYPSTKYDNLTCLIKNNKAVRLAGHRSCSSLSILDIDPYYSSSAMLASCRAHLGHIIQILGPSAFRTQDFLLAETPFVFALLSMNGSTMLLAWIKFSYYVIDSILLIRTTIQSIGFKIGTGKRPRRAHSSRVSNRGKESLFKCLS